MPFSIIRIKAAVDGYPLSMTSYRHPRPMEACGFVPFLLEVPNSSRFSLVVGILTPEPSALWKRHLLSIFIIQQNHRKKGTSYTSKCKRFLKLITL